MDSTRIKLAVYVNLDPVPGTFHSADSARNVVSNMLLQRIPHYNPTVSIESYDTAKEHGEADPGIFVIFHTDVESWNSTRQFRAVAKSYEAAREWIRVKTTTSDGYAKGPTYDVDFWLKYGFSIEAQQLH